MDDLVSTEWLEQHLGAPDLAIVDCTVFMPADRRDPAAEFLAGHIPGARFLDPGRVCDRADPAPHMLPTAPEFGLAMTQLGVDRGDRIIVYDNSPLRSATRGWFMLRHFGADRVAILDGGLPKWVAEGRALEHGDARPRRARFDAVERAGDVVSMARILDGPGLPLVDARGRARFEGSEADPREGVAAGHIPGSRNLPYAALYHDDGTLRTRDELRAAFAAIGVDPGSPFIASCGSGVTATSLLFAAHRLGGRGLLYDGSWSQWGADPATPKALGPA